MVYKDQIPWFATSNGMIDLQTSADFRDHRYTNNEIVNNNINTTENSTDNKNSKTNVSNNNKTTNSNDNVSSKGSAKSQSTNMNKVDPGGLPPLPFTGPPPPRDNELYGDILVIPPIRQKSGIEDPPPVYTRFIQVQEMHHVKMPYFTFFNFSTAIGSW